MSPNRFIVGLLPTRSEIECKPQDYPASQLIKLAQTHLNRQVKTRAGVAMVALVAYLPVLLTRD